MGLDKRPDWPMLEGACRNYARAVEADLILAEQGLLVEEKHVTEDGEVVVLKIKKHPAVEISNRAWTLVKAFCSEFGLSPVSRTRLTVKSDKEQPDDLSQMLAKLNAAPGVKPDTSRVQ